ncbi:sulfite exporter TauE/SafE family protein [Bradyrhizobium sp.]|uniref:sulfite exporter TauE/SafE family protein n=1 Tax=Bradyrhizobium sp. TaxID=376 RepID=UPI001DE48C51|nr:sulfite exporter TauE/SafE family protein [Bradyrhizobium sp.]MBI5321747.1 sulfite exporter TauE/SafE family protein [Bradyrhizobium sp.]
MLTLLFGAVSLLYATVGQAGGTAFLALMAFASFPSNEMRPTALLLNIAAATYSTWLFNRGSFVDWAKLKPLLIASLPTALVGGFIVLDENVYNAMTGIVLLAAAAILAFRRRKDGEPDHSTPLWGAIAIGAGVGFVSGLTGVGGGVFLAPILIALHWASPKQTAALSAPFILANSAVGLVGALYAGQVPSGHAWLYAVGALAGAMVGTTVGLRWLSQAATRYVLAAVLGSAGVQLLFFAGHYG